MHTTPCCWLTIHGQLDMPEHQLSPPESLQNTACAIVCHTDGPASPLSLPAHTSWLLRAGQEPHHITQPLQAAIAAHLGSYRGPHFWETSAHTMAREFALSELEDGMEYQCQGQWLEPNTPTTHIWLRGGVAWCAQPHAAANTTIERLWPGALPPTLLETLCPYTPQQCPVGVVLLDAPHAPSAHWRTHTFRQARDDLALVEGWLQRHKPLCYPA